MPEAHKDPERSEFATRMESVYDARAYDSHRDYSEFHPAYLQRVQSMEAAYLRMLQELGLRAAISGLQALDFGCGNGHWMARLASWGFVQSNVAGVDIREGAVRTARTLLPGCRIERSQDGEIPQLPGCFDVCFANLVFTSILDDSRRVQAASELQRVTRQGGIIFVLDFRFNNPANPNVRRVAREELRGLFAQCRLVKYRSLVLAPPLASLLAPRARWVAALLEAVPLLRTHFLAALCKQGPGES